jgi:uncharacterized protein YsxB (DUF464 family)
LVRVTVELFPDGCLASFRAEGHAEGGSHGANLACAAVTQLLRTAARLLCSVHGLVKTGGADTPGEMHIELSRDFTTDREWLRGVTDFLLRGIRDLEAEFPAEVVLIVK